MDRILLLLSRSKFLFISRVQLVCWDYSLLVNVMFSLIHLLVAMLCILFFTNDQLVYICWRVLSTMHPSASPTNQPPPPPPTHPPPPPPPHLQRLLVCNPALRMNGENAMAHPYFSDLPSNILDWGCKAVVLLLWYARWHSFYLFEYNFT